MLIEQDHYQILEIPRDAGPDEIEHAYRMACETYHPGADAYYSVFDDTEVAAIRTRIEDAYQVLSDPVARRRYDASLGGVEPEQDAGEPDVPVSLLPSRPDTAAPLSGFEELDAEPEPGGFDGPRLRRSRLRRGLELEEIAAVTKISTSYLRYLEEEQFDDLPARVYVRGFVKAFASCVGLDPDAVARSYMERYGESREERAGRWFGGRR